MSEELLTDATTDLVESNVEISDEVNEGVWEQTDDEFAKSMDNTDVEAIESVEATDDVTEDLEGLYQAQNDADDIKMGKPVIIKFNGKTHKIDSVQEMRNLMERGLGSTQKYQSMAEQRKLLEKLEANGYSHEDLLTLAQQDKGSELEEVNQSFKEVEDVANEILTSSYADDFKSVVSQMPDSVVEEMRQDPQMMKAMAHDVKTGLAQKIIPRINRLIDVQGMSFDEAYIQIVQQDQKLNKSVNNKRQALRSQPQRNTAPVNKTEDVWSMTDEQFNKFMDK